MKQFKFLFFQAFDDGVHAVGVPEEAHDNDGVYAVVDGVHAVGNPEEAHYGDCPERFVAQRLKEGQGRGELGHRKHWGGGG